MNEEETFEYVKKTLREERIIPYHKYDLEVVKSIENCINCAICINHCPVVAAVGTDRFNGPRSIAVELSRSPPEFWSTGDKIYLCTECGTCREVCPKSVNIPEIVNILRSVIYSQRPDLVPKGLHIVREVIHKHSLAFEPWDDLEEKIESRDMRLERLSLPHIPDEVRPGAEVLFYPGCQAEERAQEVREAAKVVLTHFDVDFSILDDMSCCGLPARLIGDDELNRSLGAKLKTKIQELGVKKVVTTCAGCTSTLCDVAIRDDWNLPVYHLLEYLYEEIGITRLKEAFQEKSDFTDVKVTVHDPCHLIKHTSRQVMEYALEILSLIPGVETSISMAPDSCCGGGGMVAYHSREVADEVVKENLSAIEETGAERLVTPCPLCTAQIENNLFRSGSSVEVDDMTVFIAQRLVRME